MYLLTYMALKESQDHFSFNVFLALVDAEACELTLWTPPKPIVNLVAELLGKTLFNFAKFLKR